MGIVQRLATRLGSAHRPALVGWIAMGFVKSGGWFAMEQIYWKVWLNEMETITYWPKEQMTKFFQRLDILATHAGYITNDNYMIGFLEPKIPAYYIDYIYQIWSIPTTYTDYKTCILEKDNLICRRQAVNTGHWVHLSVPPRSGGTQRTGSEVTYGGYRQPMDIGWQKMNRKIWTNKPSYHPQNRSFKSLTKPPPKDLMNYQCYGCGKYGHLRKDCPTAKNKSPNPHMNLHQLTKTLDESDKEYLKGF
jgi:hypothetical protein